MSTSARSESITAVGKLILVNGSQYLCYRLLNHAVCDRRNSKLPYFAFLLLGYFNPADWVGFVGPSRIC